MIKRCLEKSQSLWAKLFFFNFWNGFSYLHNLKRLKFNDFIDGTKVLWESGDKVLCYAVHPFTTDIIVTSNMYLSNTITDIEDFIVSGLGIKNMWWLGIWQRKFSLNYHCQATHQLWQCNGMNINFLLITTIAQAREWLPHERYRDTPKNSMLPREMVMRVNKKITKEKMLWSVTKLSHLIL